MNDFSKYEQLHAQGANAQQVYLRGKADGLDPITLIRMVRRVYQLSLAEAKEVTVQADGLAATLEEWQEKLLPAIEQALVAPQSNGTPSDDARGSGSGSATEPALVPSSGTSSGS
jgi:hypothetical protein